jgi:hypothetical protein
MQSQRSGRCSEANRVYSRSRGCRGRRRKPTTRSSFSNQGTETRPAICGSPPPAARSPPESPQVASASRIGGLRSPPSLGTTRRRRTRPSVDCRTGSTARDPFDRASGRQASNASGCPVGRSIFDSSSRVDTTPPSARRTLRGRPRRPVSRTAAGVRNSTLVPSTWQSLLRGSSRLSSSGER